MDALTAQTVRRLCERLESFRPKGLISALMAEYRVGAPAEETLPLPGFTEALWGGALRELPDGERVSRSIWLAADAALVAEFRNFCRDAGRTVVPLLHAAGYHVGIGTADPISSWLWAVFELAEAQLPGTILRLSGEDVFRSAGRGITVGERLLSRVKGQPGHDPLDGLIAAAGETRYWKLADAVEASLAAVDISQVRQESATPTAPHQTAATPNGAATASPTKPVPRPRGETASELLRQLWATAEGKQKILAAGSAEKIGFMIGKSATAVKEAGPIWDAKILPALEAQRSMVRYHRGEERLDG